MIKEQYTAIGLMSGTSLDGLDLCCARFYHRDGEWQFEILHAETQAYTPETESRLRGAYQMAAPDLLALNAAYGFYLGQSVSSFITKYRIGTVDVIGSHGHTVYHQPQRQFTLQIGDGRAIRQVAGIPVVYDFRSQDVMLGGQGAPLVPVGDELLFKHYSACLNIGGFSNISLNRSGQRIAADLCPVNIVLNEFAQQEGQPYDQDGRLAEAGSVNAELLDKLNALPFYQQFGARSLGFEFVEQNISPLLEGLPTSEVLRTFTEHAAHAIASALNFYRLDNVLTTGGGAYNRYLIQLIKSKTDCEIVLPEPALIEYKEALIFALMSVLRFRNEHNVLASATGSSRDHCSGLLV